MVKEVIEAAEASEVTWLLGSIKLLTIEIFRVIKLIYIISLLSDILYYLDALYRKNSRLIKT